MYCCLVYEYVMDGGVMYPSYSYEPCKARDGGEDRMTGSVIDSP
jgi:hypothetical protein